ncbi:hypothetical protein M4I32_07720 [Microbacterium sp. LRZ72]|uniref:hypothetical protein n=1 Tax=Microbacterium sp. LRZ72 TaxID=2942481 RepID=UPI0029AAB9CB|nr:hypothetical protein [Microbacterium sp. LRZ72]MDX2376687.1 hypothetical protein [Microbacterium sp. LRZ72]
MAGRNSQDAHDDEGERAEVLADLRDALDLEFIDGELLPGPHRGARDRVWSPAPEEGVAE